MSDAESVPTVPRAMGNTDTIALSKTRVLKVNPVKHYCFTYNNYTKYVQSVPEFCNLLKQICKRYVFQEETGELGTPHLQGYIELIKKERITGLKKKLGDQIRWSETRDIEGSIAYCQKEDTRTGEVFKYGFPKEIKIISRLYPWQQDVVNILSKEANDRTVNWIYDPIGNNGKTSLLKYLVYHFKAIFTTGGKNNDIINLIFNNRDYMITSDNSIVLWNLPRTVESDCISYNAIESIKDGLISNNKFECGSFICPNPHVMIFANCLPNAKTMTSDRWNVFTIENRCLVPYDLTGLGI